MMDELTMTCATVPPPARLVLGPMLFNRPPATLHDLYARIADETDIDVVHLGEVVCAKRMPFIDPHLPAIVDRLRRAGKQVVISTLALVQGARETAGRYRAVIDGQMPPINGFLAGTAGMAWQPRAE